MKMRVTVVVTCALALLAGATVCTPEQKRTLSRPPEPLKRFLRDYLTSGGKLPANKATRISVVTVRTKAGRTEEHIVYLSGDGWCGTGGCTMVILEPTESSFRVLGRVTVVQLPIRLLPSEHNGRADLGVRIRGGDDVALSFDGKRYPGNPTVPPAKKLRGNKGEVLIASDQDSVPLYE